MARLVGTAGHVDHGKTSLIRALTGIDADRLPEEKTRGLTIDIGFAYVDLPEIGRVSIVDVPGHERFLHNMLVGAMGVDVAVLCIAADESVMPQTREHLQILDLLPVERLVVALTRSDLVDQTTLEITQGDTVDLLAKTRFAGSPIVSVSALTGEGLDQLKQELATALSGTATTQPGPWYLPIDRVFTVKGHGAVVTGTLMRGTVSEGDGAEIQPTGEQARVRQVQTHDSAVKTSQKGQRTAINLGGVRIEDLHRGLLAGAPGSVFASDVLDLKVRWLSEPKHGSRIRLSIGAAEVIGKVFLNDNQPETVQVRLEERVGAAVDQPVILRRYSPPDILGGGHVTVAQAKKRRKTESVTVATGESLEDRVVSLAGASLSGVTTEIVCRTVGLSAQVMGDVFEGLLIGGRLIGFAGRWFTPSGFYQARTLFLGSLEALHDRQPAKSAFPKDEVARSAGLDWDGKPLDRIVARLVQEGMLRSKGNEVGLVGRGTMLNPAQRSLLDKVAAVLESASWSVPSPSDVARQLQVPQQAVLGVLKLGVESGEIVRIDEEIWYPTGPLNRMVEGARQHFGGRQFSASEFRDFTGSSRKYVIPVLEHLDARRTTFRRGDLRLFDQTS